MIKLEIWIDDKSQVNFRFDADRTTDDPRLAGKLIEAVNSGNMRGPIGAAIQRYAKSKGNGEHGREILLAVQAEDGADKAAIPPSAVLPTLFPNRG